MENGSVWPTIRLSSIRDEIYSIATPDSSIIQTETDIEQLSDDSVKRVQSVTRRYSQLLSIQSNSVSLKSLLLVRYWVAMQAALPIPELRESRLASKAEEVELLLKRNEFRVCGADHSDDEYNAIRRQIQNSTRLAECIEAIQQLHNRTIEMEIHRDEMQAIPQPSAEQIEKDLKREVLIFNGEPITGSQGMQRIQHAILSTIDNQLQVSSEGMRASLVSAVLQRIARTRVGEYCYGKLFPMEEGSLLITVSNKEPQPIEVQLHSGVFRKDGVWKWGACLSALFSFQYSILNLYDESNQKERVASVTMRCHYRSCIGLAEFEGEDEDGYGDVSIHIEV